MSRRLTVTIPGRPPTPNARPGNWNEQRRHSRTWRAAAVEAADRAVDEQADGRWDPLDRAHLRVLFILPDRRARDLDNLVASTKPLTDGLVDAGVLAGDSIHHITAVAYATEVRPGETATVYTIEEAAA